MVKKGPKKELDTEKTGNSGVSDKKEDISLKAEFLAEKDLFRIDEVAEYFGVSEKTIRLWIEHGHLKKEQIVGSIRISRTSILRCRFGSMATRPQL